MGMVDVKLLQLPLRFINVFLKRRNPSSDRVMD